MKNRCVKVAVALVMATSMCMAMVGCGAKQEANVTTLEPMEKEESNAVSFNFIGGKDVMPIGIFDGPHQSKWNQDGNLGPNYISDEYYQMLKDAGINLVVESKANWLTSRESLKKSLELAEKYGLGVFVGDHNITWNYDITAEEANQYLSEYFDYPAFCGITLLDEPNVPFYNRDGNANRNLDLFTTMAKVLQEEYGIHCSVNLYNAGQAWTASSRETYIRYMNTCFDELDPSIYCYDMYPHSSDPTKVDLSKVLWNMDLYRRKALEDGKPYWTYLATGGQWLLNTVDATKKPYFPNEPQFDWYMNCQLSFGCQGFIYYMCFPELKTDVAVGTDWDHYEMGMFGEFGNKNQWYYFVENSSKHLAVIDEVLMNSVSKGVIGGNDAVKEGLQFCESTIKSGKFRELESVDGEALVGCFNYNGKTALYVTNYSLEYANKIKLNLNGKYKMRVVQDAKTTYVKGNVLTLDMAAGEGALVVFE